MKKIRKAKILTLGLTAAAWLVLWTMPVLALTDPGEQLPSPTTLNVSTQVQETPDATKEVKGFLPSLQVNIPTLKFTDIKVSPLKIGGQTYQIIDIPWLAEYINAIFKYGVAIAGLLAAVMMMIGGFQYLTAGGDQGRVTRGKEKITDAVVGLAILFSSYLILNTISPQFTTLKNITLLSVSRADFNFQPEDSQPPSQYPTVTTDANCQQAIAQAKSENPPCPLGAERLISPIPGKQMACGYHWRIANYDYHKISNTDFSAAWGDSVVAPISGKIAYVYTAKDHNLGGNCVLINSTNGNVQVAICHMKDFVGDDGQPITVGLTVKQGQKLGHIGGRCCAGETYSDNFQASAKKDGLNATGWCNYGGTACTDPLKAENCACQPASQAGLTSGVHAHLTFKILGGAGGSMAGCIE